MKKQILVIFTGAMELGGIERSLLGLLDAFDYNKYNEFIYDMRQIKLFYAKEDSSSTN